MTFAPDGRTLAAARDEGTIVLSDLTDRDRPHQLGQPLTGHTGPVTAVARPPDGRTLATASVDRTARLWCMSDRNLPRPRYQPLTGHPDSVNTVAFAPDGRTLVTAGGDRTARLWDLSHLEEIPNLPSEKPAFAQVEPLMKRRGTSTRRASATAAVVPDHSRPRGRGPVEASSASWSAKVACLSLRPVLLCRAHRGGCWPGDSVRLVCQQESPPRYEGEGPAGWEPSSNSVAVSTVTRFERLAWRMNT